MPRWAASRRSRTRLPARPPLPGPGPSPRRCPTSSVTRMTARTIECLNWWREPQLRLTRSAPGRSATPDGERPAAQAGSACLGIGLAYQ